MKKALHGPERKTFRNKYLAVLVMALSFCLGAFAQTDSTKYSKIKGYGFIYKRMGTDSIQLIPLSTSPHVPYRHGAIRYNPTDSTLEYWTATQWIKAATGGAVAVDTFYAANDSTLILESGGNVFGAVVGTSRLDSLHIYTAADPSPDTLYSYKNGDSTLVGYLQKSDGDGIYSGSGTVSGTTIATLASLSSLRFESSGNTPGNLLIDITDEDAFKKSSISVAGGSISLTSQNILGSSDPGTRNITIPADIPSQVIKITDNIGNLWMQYAADYSGSGNNARSIPDRGYVDAANANDWRTTGNTGLLANINFLGTNDSVDVTFRTNSFERFRLMAAGQLRLYPQTLPVGGSLDSIVVWDASDSLVKKIAQSSLSGSGSIAYGIDSTVIGGTPGSVLFVGSDGSLQESNAAFSYDSTNSGLTITKTLGVTQNTSSGFRSFNTTAATSGNQQMPPDFVLGGQGFATTPAASQPVVMTMGLLPVQGSTNPSSTWRLRSSVNGGAFTNILQVTSAGDVTTGNTLTTGSSIISGGYVAIASGSVLRWSSRSNIGSPVDGNITLYNSAQNDFGRLQFGGTTSSFPSIKRSTTNLQVRLADDSDFGGWETGALTTNNTVTLNNNPTGLATDLLLVKGTDSVVKTIASSTFTTPVQVGGQISDSLAALPNNIQSINSQTQSTQTIAVGNGMNVTSGSGTHTISILTTFITSGRYTPTLTGVTNVAGTTTHECTYFRVGNAVTVSGIIEIDPTSSATLTELRVQLPITSGVDFATIYECSGAGNAISTQGSSGGFTADTTNEEAFFSFVTATDANQSISFSFTYFITPL